MPIRPELRHFYTGPQWQATRGRILARAANRCERCALENGTTSPRGSVVQLGVAHLDHDPANNADDNLAALCRRCHLLHDRGQHKLTRSVRKDAARPLLGAAR